MNIGKNNRFHEAVAHFQAGRWAEAESLCAKILSAEAQNVTALHLLGILHCQQGDAGKGAARLGEAVVLQPDNAALQYDLGKAWLAHGRPQDAAAAFQRALALQPGFTEAHNNLGNAHKDRGRLEDAVVAYGQAIKLNENFPEAHNNLGNVLKELGKPDDAIASYNKALAIAPQYAEAHYNLGNAFRDQGRADDAVTHYQKAISLAPDYVEAHNNLGLALQDQGKLDTAVASHNKALALAPDNAEALSNRGLALQGLGMLDEAVASYHKALAIAPDSAKCHNNLGNAQQDMGQLDAAVASYHKALAIAPDYAEAHRHLSNAYKFSEYNDDIRAMEDAYALPDLGDQQRMHLAFGLGKSFEDLRQFDKAFDFYLTANALKRGTYVFSIDTEEKNFERLKKLLTRDRFNKHQAAGSSDGTPIFILGMPRSGTTLVEQILASHGKVHGAGEVKYLDRVMASCFTRINHSGFAESLDQASDSDLSDAGDDYLELIKERVETVEFITDKMPYNFMLIGMIRLMLPNAKIIHCRRNPQDTCLSIFKNYFSSAGHYYAYDLGELGRYYNLYRDLMGHWHDVLPGFIYDICYEDLVADQEAQSRALLDHCGLEWDDACLDFHQSSRPVQTASAVQVRKPIYKDSVQSWKRYEDELAPLLEVL
jgi:tetratricopeptide (TPR) repeat protein